jgi:glycerol-3-phosphate dehydrogenase
VEKIERTEKAWRVFSEKGSVEARFVINCAGIYSDRIAALVGDDSFTVHPRKGEYMLLDKECGTIVKHTIFQPPTKMGKGILVSPTVDSNLLLGPTSRDGEDKEDHAVDSVGFEDIIQKAARSVSDLPLKKVITSFSGLRAVGSTGDFIITSPKKGFFNAAGIESPGLSSAPAIAEYLVEMLKKEEVCLKEQEDYCPTRESMHAFREADLETKKRYIQQDPAFGRIVCRCERVTEGEILAAIRQNPKATDLDGVKRRTRAQMGLCQGGFCGPYVMELLARERNIPLEQVTKKGCGSVVVTEKLKGGEVK